MVADTLSHVHTSHVLLLLKLPYDELTKSLKRIDKLFAVTSMAAMTLFLWISSSQYIWTLMWGTALHKASLSPPTMAPQIALVRRVHFPHYFSECKEGGARGGGGMV